jgi:hypothetical protein
MSLNILSNIYSGRISSIYISCQATYGFLIDALTSIQSYKSSFILAQLQPKIG